MKTIEIYLSKNKKKKAEELNIVRECCKVITLTTLPDDLIIEYISKKNM
jgi:hypothetical protein